MGKKLIHSSILARRKKDAKRYFLTLLPYIICLLFFIAYSVLSIVRHNHYQSFGFDLGINDQTVWRYSNFQAPLTTIDAFPEKTKLHTHVELIYIFISPFYWIWSSRKMLLILEVGFVCSSGIAMFLLAKKKKLLYLHQVGATFGYLSFYGVQNAMWFNVHSASFATAFLAWFLYFLDSKKKLRTILFFLLAITAKENIAFITFFISLLYFFKRRDKLPLLLIAISFSYLLFIFYIYFPHIIHFRYPYQNSPSLFSELNPLGLINTEEKRQTIFYSGLSFGFMPLLAPLYLLPTIADFFTYFVIGRNLPGAQGLFMHYRITLAPLLTWATIYTLARYKWLNNKFIAFYLFACIALVQYLLHLPLSYLTKSWFWKEPSSVQSIEKMKTIYLPETATVVSQNNITPHISQRDKIYTLYPEKHTFVHKSPCQQQSCDWFRWHDNPEFLIVDISTDWDARHFLINRDQFIKGLENLEKMGVIEQYKKLNTTILYRVKKNPSNL